MKSSACLIEPCCPDSKLCTPVSGKEMQTIHETLGMVFASFRTYENSVICFLCRYWANTLCFFSLSFSLSLDPIKF